MSKRVLTKTSSFLNSVSVRSDKDCRSVLLLYHPVQLLEHRTIRAASD